MQELLELRNLTVAIVRGGFKTTSEFCRMIIVDLSGIPLLQVRIVQRGAVRPLIKMLEAPDLQLKEMAAFALGRLAQVRSFSL